MDKSSWNTDRTAHLLTLGDSLANGDKFGACWVETLQLSQRLLPSGLEIFPLPNSHLERPYHDGCLRLSRHMDNHAPN